MLTWEIIDQLTSRSAKARYFVHLVVRTWDQAIHAFNIIPALSGLLSVTEAHSPECFAQLIYDHMKVSHVQCTYHTH